MKQILFILTFWFTILICSTVFGQVADATKHSTNSIQANTSKLNSNNENLDESSDFSPGLLFIALIVLALILVCIGVGIALTVLILLAIFGLVSFGVLSTSLIVGLNKKSFTKGFKTFLILFSTIGSLIICGIGFWLINGIVHWWPTQTAILAGITFGLLVGLVFGLIINYILKRLTNHFKIKLNLA